MSDIVMVTLQNQHNDIKLVAHYSYVSSHMVRQLDNYVNYYIANNM